MEMQARKEHPMNMHIYCNIQQWNETSNQQWNELSNRSIRRSYRSRLGFGRIVLTELNPITVPRQISKRTYIILHRTAKVNQNTNIKPPSLPHPRIYLTSTPPYSVPALAPAPRGKPHNPAAPSPPAAGSQLHIDKGCMLRVLRPLVHFLALLSLL